MGIAPACSVSLYHVADDIRYSTTWCPHTHTHTLRVVGWAHRDRMHSPTYGGYEPGRMPSATSAIYLFAPGQGQPDPLPSRRVILMMIWEKFHSRVQQGRMSCINPSQKQINLWRCPSSAGVAWENNCAFRWQATLHKHHLSTPHRSVKDKNGPLPQSWR